jgi:hypothetical protein
MEGRRKHEDKKEVRILKSPLQIWGVFESLNTRIALSLYDPYFWLMASEQYLGHIEHCSDVSVAYFSVMTIVSWHTLKKYMSDHIFRMSVIWV